MSRIIISEIVKQHPPKFWKDNKYFHELDCNGTVDGSEGENFRISVMSIGERLSQSIPVGTEINAEFKKEYNGISQYSYKPPQQSGGRSGGSSGGFKGQPRNEASIVAQSSLKASLEYWNIQNLSAKGHTPNVDDVLDVAEQFQKWVKEQG